MINIAKLIRRVARGKHGSKSLNRDEAGAVFEALLQPDADILQLGAFLIALRMKGETASELAGFVDAARSRMLNPLGCPGQLNGMFHTPLARCMAEANILLDQHLSLIFMGAEGEPELYASRQKALLLQQREHIFPLQYSDIDAENYPKENQHELSVIEDYLSVAHKIGPAWREAVVLQRMHEAFKLVSTGILPEGWCILHDP